MDFPEINTDRLVLREIGFEDQDGIFEIFSNENVVKYYDLEAFSERKQSLKLIEFFKSRYESSVGIRWGIVLKGNKKCIGTCGFNSWSMPMHSGVIGYDLNSQYWGKGIVTEAVNSILSLAYSGGLSCGVLNRIQADTVPGNIASEKVLQKLGFREEGIRRQSGYWKGKYHDLKCFSLLKEEFADNIEKVC